MAAKRKATDDLQHVKDATLEAAKPILDTVQEILKELHQIGGQMNQLQAEVRALQHDTGQLSDQITNLHTNNQAIVSAVNVGVANGSPKPKDDS